MYEFNQSITTYKYSMNLNHTTHKIQLDYLFVTLHGWTVKYSSVGRPSPVLCHCVYLSMANNLRKLADAFQDLAGTVNSHYPHIIASQLAQACRLCAPSNFNFSGFLHFADVELGSKVSNSNFFIGEFLHD